MSVKVTGQFSFVEALMPVGVGRNARLERLSGLVRWYRFEKLMKGLRDEAGPGRPAYPSLVLFKALLVQALYGLSDVELEEALADRLSFRRFIGLGLEETVPDSTTLCRFRNLLNGDGRLSRLFGELDRQLEQAGVMLKRGTMLDATLIETGATSPPKAGETPTDPDAAFSRRSGKAGFGYGYKAYLGVDEGSGLIRSVVTTPANVNDTTPADALIRGDEKVVWGDGAYHTHARERALRERGVKPRLMRRANKHHPLPPRLRRYNRLIARRRFAVETTFATWKRRMGVSCIRYLGLAKASGQILLAAMAFNMRRWATLAPQPCPSPA
jgi:IS5 family transposase